MGHAELDALASTVLPGTHPIVQPYLGHAEAEYTVGVLSDSEGAIIDSIVIRRKLVGLSLLEAKTAGTTTAAISTGISQGFIVRDETMQAYCEALARRLDSRGPLNIQLRVHDGDYYVFEIHPRFSGTTPIRASAGFNEPDVLLRHHLNGETFGRLGYRDNVAAIRAFEHVLVPIEEMIDAR
jgi:carbamoyl-phosphate synthase large subunit